MEEMAAGPAGAGMDDGGAGPGSDERLAGLEAQLRETRLRLEVERAARRLGAVDEEAVWRLMDRGGVSWDAEGAPLNAGELVGRVVRERPYLLASPGGAGNPARSDGRGLRPDDLRGMTAAAINANWPAVQQALRGHREGGA